MQPQQLAGQAKNGRRAAIGFVLPHEQFPVPELIQFGIAAEQAGFDNLWTSDHLQPWQDNEGHAGFAWITLAALSQHVQRVTMGTGVTCPTYRYQPAVVAEAFASLSLLAPGRIFLGVGAGESLNETAATGQWGTYAERAARLVEAVQIIRQLWTGAWVSHKGQYYQVPQTKLYDIPAQPIPIYMAASGPKSMRLAGEHGDGLITDAQRALMPALRQAFAEGARAAGKDPQQMPILAEHMVVVGDENDARQGAELWRFMPKSWAKYVNMEDPREIQRGAQQDVPIAEVSKSWPVSRDPSVHIQALQQLIDGGVTQIYVHSPQADLRSVIDFYGREVLPQVLGAAHAGR
jgi:TAT-translocated FGD2 family F420-dependent dehydrogenase